MIRPDQDAWAFIAPQVPSAIAELRRMVSPDALARDRAFVSLLEARYREGERLYKREWLTWPDPERFDVEVGQEVADAVTYLAMRRVLFPDFGAFR
jgi:hypothetical protein